MAASLQVDEVKLNTDKMWSFFFIKIKIFKCFVSPFFSLVCYCFIILFESVAIGLGPGSVLLLCPCKCPLGRRCPECKPENNRLAHYSS